MDRHPKRPKPQWNVALLVRDATLKGWDTAEFARQSSLTYKTADRFLRGDVQTTKTAAKLATALEQSIERYLLSVEAVA